MKHIKFYLLTLGVFCMVVSTATAQQGEAPVAPRRMTLDMAKKILAGAEKAACTPKCAGGAMVVVDNAGNIIAMETLDDTQSPSTTMAIKKAQTAALWRRPTSTYHESLSKDPTSAFECVGSCGQAFPTTTSLGGVPLEGPGGTVIGGFGVSGVRGHLQTVIDGAVEASKKLQSQ